MYYVGTSFNPADGGYKTIQNAKKAADKIGANVYDENGVKVYPVEEPEKPTAEELAAAINAPEEEKPEEIKVELTDDVPEGALEENPDGSVNTYNAEGQQVGTITKEELEKLQEAAGEKFTSVNGTITVVREGMIAIRNAASWEDGHKCGIAKTGHKARVTMRLDIAGGTLYKMENGRYISGRPEDTEFTPD